MSVNEWAEVIGLLQAKEIPLSAGLSSSELSNAEEQCGTPFPPDLREFLQNVVPVAPGFPDWRSMPREELASWLGDPFGGIAFDIEHNSFWWPAWGPRPAQLAAAKEVARAALELVPRLVPIFGHRFLPTEPLERGNPVFSVVQTDIIYYGRDLRSYFEQEFGGAPYHEVVEPAPRFVRFWSELVRRNDERAG
jgi:hypothetical protein